MSIAEVLLATSRLSSRDAAPVFARAGTPIFPCATNGKRPLTAAGFNDASCDLEQVGAWWARWPTANIGMPTGGPSGIDVVDIDVADADSGFAAFECASAAGLVDGELARVRTPSGGLHVYFPATSTRPQRCWQAAAAHIDFRGDGGYVIVPPSTLMTNHRRIAYRLFSLSAAVGRPIDAVALRGFVDPRLPRTRSRPETVAPEPSRLASWVGGLREGERNRGLFWAACRLAEAGFMLAAVEEALGPAAASAGLPEMEITATIRSASRRAAARPHCSAETTWANRPVLSKRAGGEPCLQ